MKSSARTRSGFSLIELLVTMTILGIAILMGLPSFSAWMQNTRIRNTAESILNGLQSARNEAVRRNSSVQFVLNGAAWTISCVVTTPGCPDTDPIQSRSAGEGSGSSITITAGNGNTVVFNNFGLMTTPAIGAGGVAQFDVDIDHAILTAAASRDLRITVNAGGVVRMCDPNVVAPDARAC